ncbi:response regulator [Phenylobacterium deserti]|uniref:Response regulator n=1 Tax=Phenylobacterium deserti TaxID=1914756 RepID=A0A328ANF3_9CAUL|nr:response regulator [Phenylobacterium deserti]RAK56533.1 response regulator [Phenylobacterium deserti]
MASVLVVEDEPLIAEIVKEAISDQGHSVVTASCAREAYSLLEPEARSFAAIVTDVDLGAGPNGFALARRARELNPDIQVAYMTGSAANLRHFEADKALMFPKPFSPTEMAEQLDLLIGS